MLLAEDAPDAYQTNTPTATLLRITDNVGTLRGRQDLGSNWDGACTSFPYGDGMACTVPPLSSELFTGKDRDQESGDDYFGARYYASSMGRFTSADDGTDQDPSNPQSWNLYSYVRNNPVTRTDSDGRSVNVCTNDASGNQHCTLLSNDQYTAAQQGNGSLNVPTLDQVGNNQTNGTFNATSITDANGNTVGTATYSPDNPGIDPFVGNNGAGLQQLSNTSKVVTAGTAIYAGVYGAVGAAIAGPPAAAAAYRFILQRLALSATSPALIAVVKSLYQDTDEIPGGTAGAVRNEVTTCEFLNGGHAIKAAETINRLNNLIDQGKIVGSHDLNIAYRLISDLKNSLGR